MRLTEHVVVVVVSNVCVFPQDNITLLATWYMVVILDISSINSLVTYYYQILLSLIISEATSIRDRIDSDALCMVLTTDRLE